MARTTLNKTTPLGPFGTYAADAADLVLTAADVANKNQFVATGTNMVMAWNSGASTYTVTITSAADERGRTGDITAYTLAAGDHAIFGPFDGTKGWPQADGYVYLEGSNAAVKFAVIVF